MKEMKEKTELQRAIDLILTSEDKVIDPKMTDYPHRNTTLGNTFISTVMRTHIGEYDIGEYDLVGMSLSKFRERLVLRVLSGRSDGNFSRLRKAHGNIASFSRWFKDLWQILRAVFYLTMVKPLIEAHDSDKPILIRGVQRFLYVLIGFVAFLLFLPNFVLGTVNSTIFKNFSRYNYSLKQSSGGKAPISTFLNWTVFGSIKLILDKVFFLIANLATVITGSAQIFVNPSLIVRRSAEILDALLRILPEIAIAAVVSATMLAGFPVAFVVGAAAFTAILASMVGLIVGRLLRPPEKPRGSKEDAPKALATRTKILGVALTLSVAAGLVTAFVLTGGLGFPAAVIWIGATITGASGIGMAIVAYFAAQWFVGFSSWFALDAGVSNGKVLKTTLGVVNERVVQARAQARAQERERQQEVELEMMPPLVKLEQGVEMTGQVQVEPADMNLGAFGPISEHKGTRSAGSEQAREAKHAPSKHEGDGGATMPAASIGDPNLFSTPSSPTSVSPTGSPATDPPNPKTDSDIPALPCGYTDPTPTSPSSRDVSFGCHDAGFFGRQGSNQSQLNSVELATVGNSNTTKLS